jgi:AraC family transcriptional regulator
MQMMGALQDLLGLEEEETRSLHEGLVLGLSAATTTEEMFLAFREGLERLRARATDPGGYRASATLEKVKRYLAVHFREPLRIVQLARLAGVSTSTFSRRFKRTEGVKFETYLQDLRLEASKGLLREGGLPVSVVARNCGFPSPAHFTRLFKARMGLTPQNYRRQAQGGPGKKEAPSRV